MRESKEKGEKRAPNDRQRPPRCNEAAQRTVGPPLPRCRSRASSSREIRKEVNPRKRYFNRKGDGDKRGRPRALALFYGVVETSTIRLCKDQL